MVHYMIKRGIRWISLVSLMFLVAYTIASYQTPVYSEDLCTRYFTEVYYRSPEWNNNMLHLTNDLALDTEKLKQMMERTKFYFGCPANSLHMFPDLETRMFPFLNPLIVSKDKPLPWENYNGRGIVITFKDKDLETGKRLIKVIRSVSDMPIQVIHQDELSEVDLGENVSVIDARPFINSEYQIGRFLNKWLAVLFSTFEEIILLDVDAVPFISPEELFEMYDGTTLLFKDRDVGAEISPACKYTFDKLIQPNINKYDDTLAKFMIKHKMHLIDSGLVITNRKEQMRSLVMGMMMNLATVTTRCLWGDKEFFWLGHIFMEQRVTVHKQNTAVIGKERNGRVCASQMAHLNEHGKLLWLNGGLKNCKFEDAWQDEEDIEAAAVEGYHGDDLRKFYESPVSLDVAIVASENNPWIPNKMCSKFSYCLNADVTSDKYNTLANAQHIVDTWWS